MKDKFICNKCGGIKFCSCEPIIDTSQGANSPEDIPNDQD
jgi:hypothetical protein